MQITFIYPGAQPEIFQGRGGFMELGHFKNILSKTKEKKKNPLGKILEIFLIDTLKTFWIENLTQGKT